MAMMPQPDRPAIEPITATVEQFAALSGLGRTSIYELINSGALRSVRIMGRRLIVVESYRELVRQAEATETSADVRIGSPQAGAG